MTFTSNFFLLSSFFPSARVCPPYLLLSLFWRHFPLRTPLNLLLCDELPQNEWLQATRRISQLANEESRHGVTRPMPWGLSQGWNCGGAQGGALIRRLKRGRTFQAHMVTGGGDSVSLSLKEGGPPFLPGCQLRPPSVLCQVNPPPRVVTPFIKACKPRRQRNTPPRQKSPS